MISNVKIKHGSFYDPHGGNWAIFTDVFYDLDGSRAYARFSEQLTVEYATIKLKGFAPYRR